MSEMCDVVDGDINTESEIWEGGGGIITLISKMYETLYGDFDTWKMWGSKCWH